MSAVSTSDHPPLPKHVPVLVAGGGPVGLAFAALLARHGTPALVIEADDGYCSGSRAICISRRSQEILGWIGAAGPLCAEALPWTGGRSFFRDTEVLHFTMPTDPNERFAPMVNIQQYVVERVADDAGRAAGVVVRWSHRIAAVRPGADGAEVDVALPDGQVQTVRCDWLVACDGGRSTVREQLGLQLEGTQYEGRYVIVDIEQETARPTERLAWFDPLSNPGSTILMHRQPGKVWRIDYQVADDEDPQEAVRPENVLPRVASHLAMIGETAPWKPLWISIYNAKCLTLASYRHGRVLFAGDAAHLVPIFGVRGLNSGLDDAGNLAWKLALVAQGRAADRLLESYSQERVGAARENIAYGAKSTEFMAPPHPGFALLREAALRLATVDASVRSLVNPRQSAPVEYRGSALNLAGGETRPGPLRAGLPAPEALLEGAGGPVHLTALLGRSFVVLHFTETDAGPGAEPVGRSCIDGIDRWRIGRSGVPGEDRWVDRHGEAWSRFGAAEGDLWLVRPDGYVAGRWSAQEAACIGPAVRAALGFGLESGR